MNGANAGRSPPRRRPAFGAGACKVESLLLRASTAENRLVDRGGEVDTASNSCVGAALLRFLVNLAQEGGLMEGVL